MANLTLSENEKKEFLEFKEKHKDCEFTSTTGGKFAFTIVPTGLGDVVIVKCNACGETRDITDISGW